jgi:hydrogenase-4 component F
MILFIPIISGLLALLLKNKIVNRVALLGSGLLYLIISIACWFDFSWYWFPAWLLTYFHFDTTGLYFFSIMTLVFCSSAVYSLFYFKEHALPAKNESIYVAEILSFVAVMSGAILAVHLALFWVFVEATTLTSALLIYFEKKKSSLEAAWKYIFICSIGIALAFVGIIVLSIGSRHIDSLFFPDLYNHAMDINPFWLKVSFAFIFVGLGTKIGVAPIHAWLPDAHSEAPSPVSALLSGTLLNTAFLGLLRVQGIMIHARQESFSNFIFLITGFLSLLISAVFILRLKNYKRMLAYSSVENMGILFIGVSLGAYGIFAVMLHVLAHSLSKASLFLTSGNIHYLYKSKRIKNVAGLLQTDRVTGWLWIVSMLSITGIPPFPIFISKFILIKAFWLSGMGWLSLPFLLLMVIVAFGMVSTVFKMTFGNIPVNYVLIKKPVFYAYVPQIILLIILTVIGINMPQRIFEFMNNATSYFK